jgi:hypothetical protein
VVVRAFSFVWLAGMIAFSGCGRDTDFLYHLENELSLGNRFDHPLKELQGNSKVDILFVVDNSPSMDVHQANLKKNADFFIDKFVKGSRLDWRIALASTDLKNPPFVGMTPKTLLDRSVVSPVSVFQNAVSRLGLAGDSTERSMAAAIQALRDNSDFMRPGATLATILMTDATEQSELTGDEYVQKLRELQPAQGAVIVYGVLANKDFGCDTRGEEDYEYATSPYQRAIELTQGKVYKLCEDFGNSLADLGDDLVTRVNRPFIQLASRPYLKTVQVLYQGQPLAGGPQNEGGLWFYDFDLNRVVFYSLDFAPADNESVTVVYDSQVQKTDI